MSKKMYKTQIDLPLEMRDQLVTLLNQQLADTFDLYSQTKQAHWNVKGSDFIQLHEFYDKLAGEVLEHVDLIAERATTLGGTAEGTARMAAAMTRLPDYPADEAGATHSIELLAERYAALAATTRAAIDKATELNDADTADIFTEVSRALDKSLWFIEAHIQE